jgi:hypothetical protein
MIITNIGREEKEAEAAVAEFLEVRAAILGRLSPEALRCVPGILYRHLAERDAPVKSGQLADGRSGFLRPLD